MPKRLFILLDTMCLYEFLHAQNCLSTIARIFHFPSSFFAGVKKKTSTSVNLLTRQTERYLHKQGWLEVNSG